MLTAEFFFPQTVQRNAADFMRSLISACPRAGMKALPFEEYRGEGDWLVIYGAGGDDRAEPWRRHLESGRRVILWDLGYWQRDPVKSRLWRMSIDEWHPQDLLSAVEPNPSRYLASQVGPLREDAKDDGHILLCGLGKKSRKFLGHRRDTWEMKTLSKIRAAYPGRRIVYRPKPGQLETLPDVEVSRHVRIEEALKGASLVVCRHSNVAVDAAIAGVPCVCEDGAGAYLYGSDVANPKTPTREERQDFVYRLAWFQWGAWEAHEALKFARKLTGD
jgi:hypothetical protein